MVKELWIKNLLKELYRVEASNREVEDIARDLTKILKGLNLIREV